MQPEVELRYVPRSNGLEPRVRLIVFRNQGSAILDIRYSVISEFCQPASEGHDDMLSAFRQCVPALVRILNPEIAKLPAGGVLFVTHEKFAATGRKQSA
jgi:hypothetical protein